MRDINPALKTAQEYEIRKPYRGYVFHSDSGDEVDYSDRDLGGIYYEMPFSSKATILLNNNDDGVKFIEGYWVDIFFGEDLTPSGGSGYKGVHSARLWVKSQMRRSKPNVKQVILELEGAWEKLAEKPCFIETNMLAPYHYTTIDLATPFFIITLFLNQAGFGMQALEQDDGIINSLIPSSFSINKPQGEANGEYESFKDGIVRALFYTMSYLNIIHDIGGGPAEFKVVFPEEGAEPDLTYYSYQPHFFFEFVYRKNVVIPNKILTYCDYDEEIGDFRYPLTIGQAEEQESIQSYGEVVKPVWFKDVSGQSNANNVAQAVLGRMKIESKGGRLIIPVDYRVELFDKAKVVDTR